MAAQILRGSPAGLGVDTSRSFNNQDVAGVKSLSGGDAGGLAITATGAGGLELLCATAGGISIGAAAGTLVGLHGAAPVAQTTNAVAAAAFVAGAGAADVVGAVSTFGGYTIGQIVAALQLHGILA